MAGEYKICYADFFQKTKQDQLFEALVHTCEMCVSLNAAEWKAATFISSQREGNATEKPVSFRSVSGCSGDTGRRDVRNIMLQDPLHIIS